MSNDPKQQKTIMGWSPGQFPAPGQPPQPQPPAQAGWPQQPVAAPPQQQAWAQQPPMAPPQQQAWPQQPPMAPPQQQAWPQQPQAAMPQQQAWPQQPPMAPPQQQAWPQQPQAAMPPPQPPAWQQVPAMGSQPAGGRAIANADATTGVSARLRFIRLTYLHLFGAILAFTGIEWLLMTNATLVTKVSVPLVTFALGGRFNWAIVLGVFSALSIATHWLANHTRSKPLHYIGLTLYVVAEALIFVPLLAIVQWKTAEIIARGGGNPNIVRDAAFITLGVFGALTLSVMLTRKDFSFLGGALAIGGAAAMGLIVLSLAFGFNLGIVFAIGMVVLAAGQILYETSQVMAHYDPEDYVGASLSLFSSVALLFWYVIQIVMKMRD